MAAKPLVKGPRITGGEFRNRRLGAVVEGVRPAMDKTRQALFSMLGPAVQEASVLDLYAGTGAYGFECMSRGGARVCWVDSSHEVVKQIDAQLLDWELPGDRFSTVCGDVLENLDRLIELHEPNLIIADPPYDLIRSSPVHKMTLQKLHLNPKLPSTCFFIAEQPLELAPPEEEGWSLIRDRTYGRTRLIIYRREN